MISWSSWQVLTLGGRAEKITHPILVGLLHPEKGNSGRSFQSCTFFAPQPHKPPLQWMWVAVSESVTPYGSQSQLHQVERPFTCAAPRTVYQKNQNSNGFCKDIVKLYEKLTKFRVHRDSLASGYWRRCSFHCRFLFNFGGASTSGSERQMEQVSEQGLTAI